MPEDAQAQPGRQLRIRRTDPHSVPPIFANDFAISHTDREVFLTFSLIQPPLAIASDELATLTSIDATAVAKIVVTPALAQAIVKAMTSHLQREGAAPK